LSPSLKCSFLRSSDRVLPADSHTRTAAIFAQAKDLSYTGRPSKMGSLLHHSWASLCEHPRCREALGRAIRLRRSVHNDVGQFVTVTRHIHSVVLNRHRCRQKQYLQFLCASSGRSSKMSTLETARDIARCITSSTATRFPSTGWPSCRAPQSSNFRTAATPRKKVVCFALSIYSI
jgi:hypothetical protein